MRTEELTYLAVGHVSHDVDSTGEIRVGGTVSYSAMMARQLGWRPFIVTSAGPDFRRPECLAEAGWHIVPSSTTTAFHNTQQNGRRRQRLTAQAAPITADDIAGRNLAPTLVHLAPVAQEFDPTLAEACGEARLVITPQGWMRAWDEDGQVSAKDWQPATLPRPAWIIVLSPEDIAGGQKSRVDEMARWTDVLVLTEAAEGCTVFKGGHRVHVSGLPASFVDSTGAGDIFTTAFAIRYWETGNVAEAANFANAAASLSVEGAGLEGVPERQAVMQRLTGAARPGDERDHVGPTEDQRFENHRSGA